MTCHCRTNPGKTVVVCDPCASKMMEAQLGLLPEQDQHLAEKPTVLTKDQYDGMQSAVDGWFNVLGGAK